MHKRMLALICTAVLMLNLVSVENWSMITRAEEQEEQTEEETESVEEAEPEEITGTAEGEEAEKETESAEEDTEPEGETESEEEMEPEKIQLQVKVTEGTAKTPIATKVSDGTTALTRDNITAIENAFSLEGIVDGDEVSLKVRDDAPWSSLSYEENKLGSNAVSLNSLKDSFELE